MKNNKFYQLIEAVAFNAVAYLISPSNFVLSSAGLIIAHKYLDTKYKNKLMNYGINTNRVNISAISFTLDIFKIRKFKEQFNAINVDDILLKAFISLYKDNQETAYVNQFTICSLVGQKRDEIVNQVLEKYSTQELNELFAKHLNREDYINNFVKNVDTNCIFENPERNYHLTFNFKEQELKHIEEQLKDKQLNIRYLNHIITTQPNPQLINSINTIIENKLISYKEKKSIFSKISPHLYYKDILVQIKDCVQVMKEKQLISDTVIVKDKNVVKPLLNKI